MEDGEGGEVDVGVSVLEEGLEVGDQVVEGGLVELVEALDEHDGLLLDGGPRDRNGGRGVLLVVDELAHELGQGGDHIDGEQLAAGDDGGADLEVVLALEILQMEAGAGRIQFEFC